MSACPGSSSSGRSTSQESSTSARFTRSTTGICEWSDITITAWSSRNASGPPAACMMRSSARSAEAIDVTCEYGPRLCE